MADFEIHAPDNATMLQAAQAIGRFSDNQLRTGGFSSGTLWALNVYGVKSTPTGRTIKDLLGLDVPEMAPLPGLYAILRWEGDPALLPALPAGSTIIPRPNNSPYRFAS